MPLCAICDEAAQIDCTLCHNYVCVSHAKCYYVKRGEESHRVCVCTECQEMIESIKKKPSQKWSDEEKNELKKMASEALKTAGKVGLIAIAAILSFALGFLKKALKGEEGFEDISQEDLKGYSIGEEGGEESFPTDELIEELYGEEPIFGEEKVSFGEE